MVSKSFTLLLVYILVVNAKRLSSDLFKYKDVTSTDDKDVTTNQPVDDLGKVNGNRKGMLGSMLSLLQGDGLSSLMNLLPSSKSTDSNQGQTGLLGTVMNLLSPSKTVSTEDEKKSSSTGIFGSVLSMLSGIAQTILGALT
ncbi:uncharacterized protein LOC106064231 [Biomphalaria glabrata]|uniref:Uncharacterized protein LOC106064231 n=1 Tax=Biomphalaria glabrata TaxID=6526 RepID=A0A9W2Z7J4_BIOGL|nr:uncharacterized protein LOC106064231 [Biomphalaria glabrata]